jgi:hypothetical protein
MIQAAVPALACDRLVFLVQRIGEREQPITPALANPPRLRHNSQFEGARMPLSRSPLNCA